ncbi:hypothetical protein SARC_15776, partial [Sphaeroforma arctica JP610]
LKVVRGVTAYLFLALQNSVTDAQKYADGHAQTDLDSPSVLSDNGSYSPSMLASDLIAVFAQNEETSHLAMHCLMREALSTRHGYLTGTELLLSHFRSVARKE